MRYSDNPYQPLDTRPQRLKDEQERLMWERRRKPEPWQPLPDPPNEDPWAEPPPTDPFAESAKLHHPKGQTIE